MDKFTILAFLALGFGCDDKGDSVGESDTDTDTDSDTDTDADPTGAEVDWDAKDTVSVTITGGTGDLKWGIVEGGAKAWTAEDCIGGTYAGFGPYCHTVAADATTIIDCAATDTDASDDATLFCLVPKAQHTYYFATMDDSWCAVSGPDASYYDSEGCIAW